MVARQAGTGRPRPGTNATGKRGRGGTHRRLLVRAVLAAVVAATIAGGFPMGAPPSWGQEGLEDPAPRPTPAPKQVTITPTGFDPLDVTVVAGQTVEFTNASGAEQTVDDAGTLFDSGPIPDGGGFSIAFAEPGFNEYTSAANPDWIGSITVGRLELPGPPDAPVNEHLPEITVPPATDLDEIPEMGIGSSRTRLMVAFRDTTTVAEANAALAAADVHVVAATPAVRMVLVAVDDPGVGQFDPVRAAEETLRADPAVERAGLDLERSIAAVPGLSETALTSGPTDSNSSWTWVDEREANGSGKGSGGNYGMEQARFPQAWNLLDALRLKGTVVDTVVLDVEFSGHPDLNMSVKTVCNGNGACSRDHPPGEARAHGTHVSGIVGAAYNNPMTGPGAQAGRVRGVDGGNPVGYLYGSPVTGLHGNVFGGFSPQTVDRKGWTSSAITETYAHVLRGKKDPNLWPNLQVVNVSMGTINFKREGDPKQGPAKWGKIIANLRCGPGPDDDKQPGPKGPCTPQTFDPLQAEIAVQGGFALELARIATEGGITLVWAAGNESHEICEYPNGSVSQPPCGSGGKLSVQDAGRVVDAGWASRHLFGDENPFVIVESEGRSHTRSTFSNTGGTVSAPGERVLSTVEANAYEAKSGTSMSAPHVTALVGLLKVAKPDLTYTQIRTLLRDFGWNDVTDGGAPRIDAFNALLASDPAIAKALVDINDSTHDGNRRLIRSRFAGATPQPDVVLGPTTTRGDQLHTDPDGQIDMRDFRRFRDAFLYACKYGPGTADPAVEGCPLRGQIVLDGAADHPKKDLNLDGCVAGTTATCTQSEYRFSRFDFNGDGKLNLHDLAPLPIVVVPAGGTKPAPSGQQMGQFTDLDVLTSWWDPDPTKTEGYQATDLQNLLASGDLEVHADALFLAGATSVEVTANYGEHGEQKAPRQTITDKGRSVVITTPANGTPVVVTAVGHRTDGSAVRAYPAGAVLAAGGDARVDLCTPTILAVPETTRPFTDAGTVDVNFTVLNCGQAVQEETEVVHSVRSIPGGPPPASTVAAPRSKTDKSGRGRILLRVAPRAESFELVVETEVDLDPATPGPERVTGVVQIDVAEVPRLLYKWEQVTDHWHMDEHGWFTDQAGQTQEYDIAWTPQNPDEDLVLERQGTVTPVEDGPDDRSTVRIVEDVGANPIRYRTHTVRTDGTSETVEDTLAIPPSRRHRDVLSAETVVDIHNEDGSLKDPREAGNTYFETVEEDEVVIRNLEDIGGVNYGYWYGDTCGLSDSCRTLIQLDQISLTERTRGSSLAWAEEMGDFRALTFTRDEGEDFGTYAWCSEPREFEMRQYSQFGFTSTGTARSRFRIVATITTDPEMTPDDLEFPVDCESPAPPDAAIARDWVAGKEGDLLRFFDASSDPNGDVVERAWDFGDGHTSDELHPRHRFEDDGSYLVRLTVVDSRGEESTAELRVEIDNATPEVDADPVRVEEGEPVLLPVRLFDAGERDQEALTLKVSWQGGGTSYADVTTKGGATTLNLGTRPPGSHRLTLEVRDKDGASATTTVEVEVGGGAPVPAEPVPEIETEPAPGCVFGVRLDVDEQLLLELHNAYRTGNGLPALSASPTLTAAAEVHGRWLRDNDLVQHEGPDDNSPFQRAIDAGYPGEAVGENLTRGQFGPAGAMVAWKISDAHNLNLLNPQWRAAGIARIETVHGPLWVVVFGDEVDCPSEPPDFEEPNPDASVDPVGPPVPVVLSATVSADADRAGGSPATTQDDPRPSAPAPGMIVLSPSQPEADAAASSPGAGAPATSVEESADRSAPPDAGTPSDPGAPAPAQPAPIPPAAPSSSASVAAPGITAFTTSVVAPETGGAVTVTNRSAGHLSVDPGDGRAPFVVAPGGSAATAYLDPGAVTLQGTADGLTATRGLDVGGTALPPVVTYTGPTAAAQGARVDLRAKVETAAGVAVLGRTVEFRIGGREASATTDAAGEAVASFVVDLDDGSYTLVVGALATESGPGATVSSPFTVSPNTPPVAQANGPYDVELGASLALDTTGSLDPDGIVLTHLEWDLDDDGQFDDAVGNASVPWDAVTELVCGGACDPAVSETIRLRATDAAGGEGVASATVTFRRDFAIGVGPDTALVNPGGNIGFQVSVTTQSAFDQPVVLSAPDLPPGVTATFTPPTVVPNGTSVMNLSVATSAAAYDGAFTVRGTSGAISHDATSHVRLEFGLVPACTVDADVRVVDAMTGEPIAGAMVLELYPTDADGRVHLTGLSLLNNNYPINKSFSATAVGYWFGSVTQLLACGIDADVVIPLEPAVYGTIAGQLVEGIPDPNDHSSGRAVIPTDRPLGVSTVGYRRLNDPLASMSYRSTDAEGSFAIDQLVPSAYATQYASEGYWTEGGSAPVTANEHTFVRAALVKVCSGDIDVRVVDDRTRLPLAGATIGIGTNRATTDGGGRARLTGAELGFRNSAKVVTVAATYRVNGRDVTHQGSGVLADCGAVAVVDIAMRLPVDHFVVVKGRVTNRDTGEPVAGATVTPGMWIGPSLITDADGYYESSRFRFGSDDPPYLDTMVTFGPPPDRRDEFDQFVTRVPVRYTPDAVVTVDGTLAPQQFSSIAVQVVDADTGEPVPGAEVGPTPQLTDAEGRTTISGIRTQTPTTHQLAVRAPGFVTQAASVMLVVGGTAELTVRLVRLCAPATITGRVRNAATGEPIEGASIWMDGRTPDGQGRGTDADGRFTYTRVEVRDRRETWVTITATKQGFYSASRQVQLYCGARLTVDIGAPNTGVGSLSGVVTRLDTGAPVPGAIVAGEWGQVATAQADGSYSFPNVPLDGAVGSRVWSIFVTPPVGSGLGSVEEQVTITAGQPTTRDVALPAPPPNERPTAIPQELVMPDGQIDLYTEMTGTDPEGQPLMFRIVTPQTATFSYTHNYPDPRVRLVLTAAATEGRLLFVASDGYQDSEPAEIVVRRGGQAENLPPIATIEPFDDVEEGGTRTFDGSASRDPDGSIAGLAWDLDGDGQYDDSTAAMPSWGYPDDATVTIGLRVTDDQGATTTTSRVLTVRNVSPSVSVGDDVTLGADGVLDRAGSFTDPGADTWTATIDWGDGAGEQPLALNGSTFSLGRTFAPGVWTVVVEVCDDDGGCGADTLVVTVPGPPNQPPVATVVAPGAVVEGDVATFDATGSSDPDGSVVAWAWDLDGDGGFDDAVGPLADIPTADDLTAVVAVRVTDDRGATDVATAELVVVNADPTVSAGDDVTLEAPGRLTRDGSFADPGADTWVGSVDLGEGAGPQLLAVGAGDFTLDHTFATAGTYPVAVRVCDDDGGCGEDTFVVTVTEPPAPVADLAITKVHEGSLVAGGTVEYELAVTNAGPHPAAGVRVVDTLPAGMAFASADGQGWTCDAVGQVVTCTRPGATGPGALPVLRVRATVDANLAAGTTVTNRAAVRSETADPDGTDDEAEDPGTVVVAVTSADLSVTLVGPGTVRAGESATWTATVTNDGPDDAGEVTVTVSPPDGLIDVVASGAGWTCEGSAPVVCTRPDLAAGASADLTVTGVGAAAEGSTGGVGIGGGVETNAGDHLEVRVTGSAPDPDRSDNETRLAVALVPAVTTTTTTTTSTTSTTTPSSTTTTTSSPTSTSTTTTAGPTPTATSSTSVPGPSSTAPGATSDPAPSTTGPAGDQTAAAAATTTTAGALPTTGSSPWPLVVLGLASVAAGAAALAVRRRRSGGAGVS